MLKKILPLGLAGLMLLSQCSPSQEKHENLTKEANINAVKNPIFNEFNHPISFSSISANHIPEATEITISNAKQALKQLLKIKSDSRTKENTLIALDNIYAGLGQHSGTMYLLSATSPDSLIRNNATDANKTLGDFYTELSLNEKLYNALKSFKNSENASILNEAEKKFLNDEIKSFERNGLGLDKNKKKELKAIKEKLNGLGLEFDKNIAEYKDFIIVSEEQTKGLSEEYKKARRQEDGTYKIGLSNPDYSPVLRYAESDELRKELFIKRQNIGGQKNLEVLDKMLKLRKQLANLLGYETYAAFKLSSKMAKDTKTVWEFENGLLDKATPKAKADIEELLEVKRAYKKDQNINSIEHWESAFYRNILLKEKYSVDQEKVKEYFEINNVIDGFFKITQNLFGVEYSQVENPDVWHSDVTMYEVKDNGKLIGRFYLDLHPRANKYNHAMCQGFIYARQTPKAYQIPNASLVCNFPQATADSPALMSHADVELFFHEFGHVLHQMLTEAQLFSQSGTKVDADFVEAPSQILENWAWEYESLELFAKHHETGETLPKEMFDKMLAAKNVGSGLYVTRQLFYGIIDMELHDRYDPNGSSSTTDVLKDVYERTMQYPFTEGIHTQAGFGHLNDYAANYYGYMWSNVFAADMFSRFANEGVLNAKTGKDYRDFILAKGSSKEAQEILKDFLGRKPKQDSFIKSLGI
ncbi:M3 family metallopeptidase [Aureibacter tunicatorum]|uniref:Thimet oligopeptidase n=1 Tax=Aureibacter tunicatorum TaxID=866807 RepID=A0AAE4BS09_9BACT|nr:M3 family metallopeptidase [Aureibacter tunicatorum]MDR6238408.1 thimet oligopeptidase [Aureibacter tunicatorum]